MALELALIAALAVVLALAATAVGLARAGLASERSDRRSSAP